MVTALVVTASLVLGQFGFPLTPGSYPQGFPYDDGSWKKPLVEKERELRQMMLDRHTIDGLYASQLTLVDGKSDLTTLGHADVSHSIHWTSLLLVGEIYRWKTTQDPADLERVREVFNAVDRCQRINQVPGVLSRGYLYGHGPSYEERRGHGRTQDRWWQGTGEFEGYRWRGNPSHHNHSAFFRAMGAAWTLIDDEEIRQKVRENVQQVMQRTYIENELRVVDHDGVVTATLGGRGTNPSKSELFVTTALKIGAEVTKDPKVIQLHDKLVEQLKYREWAHRPAEELAAVIRRSFDDDDQCFHHLHTLILLEKDEELLKFYRNFAEALWIHHKDDRQPPYNVLYHLVTGNDPKADDVRWWLKYYPTNKVFQPRMHSFLPGAEELALPLPMSQRPFDNEWEFKSDPARLDGWASRYMTDVTVSALDPMIVFACDDEGYLYRSNDGGKTWMDTYLGLGGAKARAVLPSPQTLEVVLAATDRGVMRSRDFGHSWEHVLGTDAKALALDPAKPGVAYALVSDGFYESVPFDAISFGFTWRKTGGDGPPWPIHTYRLINDAEGIRFIAQDERNSIWGSAPGRTEWEYLSRPGGGRTPLAVITGNGGRLLALSSDSPAVMYSADGGVSWQGRGMRGRGQEGGMRDIRTALVDPVNKDVFYAAGEQGLWVSRDAGQSWERSVTGMDIPMVAYLGASGTTGRVFAGTRGGLVWSDDMGATWQRGNLVPQFEGSTLMETGPADFMVGYWLARYVGIVTEEQAAAPWSE